MFADSLDLGKILHVSLENMKKNRLVSQGFSRRTPPGPYDLSTKSCQLPGPPFTFYTGFHTKLPLEELGRS